MTHSPLHLSSSTNPAATSQGPPRSVRFPLNFPLRSSCVIYGPCHTIKQLLVQYGIMEPSSLLVGIMQGKPGTRDFMLPFHFTCIVIILKARLWMGLWTFTDVTTVHNTCSVSTCWWLSTYMLAFFNLIFCVGGYFLFFLFDFVCNNLITFMLFLSVWRYNWHATLCMFKVYYIMICTYIDHHNKFN